MSVRNNTKSLLLAFGAALALAGCGGGADEIVSPGLPANPPPATTPPPPTPPPPPPSGGAAASCPDGTVNQGTIDGGTIRACRLPATITGELILKKIDGLAYQITGLTGVGVDAGGDGAAPAPGYQKGTLYIEPGVTLFGTGGTDLLLVNRGSQIFALGTKEAPVTFTSLTGLEGTATADTNGQWGGLVLAGRAPINKCTGAATPGTATCQSIIEGVSNGFYGGNKADDNSGELKYVRVLYSGYALSPGNELQSLTLAGVGNGTKIEYFQSYNTADDGIEIFGGTVNLKHIVITNNADDGLDTDAGWMGGAQFGLITRRTYDAANNGSGFEWSGSATNTPPPSEPKVSNFTIVSADDNLETLVKVNEGSHAHIFNSVFVAKPAAPANADAATCFNLSAGTAGYLTSVEIKSALFTCATQFKGSSQAVYDAGTKANVTFAASTLSSEFVNGASENAVPFTPVKALYSFFDDVTYVGAVKDAADTWWDGWTCGIKTGSSCNQ